MNRREIALRRLYNLRLWGTPCEHPKNVLQRLAAMQAQEFAYARWSVCQRASGSGHTAIDQAFANGTILRTHILRPTWHFVLPADIRWMLDLTAPRIKALSAYQYRKLGLDEAVFAKSNAVIAGALKGGRQLTRRELSAALHSAGMGANGLHLGYLLMRAELDAVVCSGALHGKQHTYASFDERVPPVKALDREDALAELTRRYFISRGPATLKDYLQWSSLTAADGKRGLAMIQSQLDHVVADGRRYWFSPCLPGAMPSCPVIDLVQGYDEYVMSYSESKDVVYMKGGLSTPEGGGAAYTHAILLNGELIGHWRHQFQKNAAVVQTQLHRPLKSREARELAAAVERFGRFMEMPTVLL